MRAAEWKRFTQPILGTDWRFSKSLAYRVPVGWILHGLLAEESAAQRPGFYLWIVRMPLVPAMTVIDLSWSERFGGPSRVFEPTVRTTRAALTRAAEIVIEQSAIGSLPSEPGGVDNVRMQETRAYGLLLDGNPGGAIEVLGRVARYEPRYPWEEELVRRAAEMRSLVEEDQPTAICRLEGWRSESMTTLGIVPN